MVGSSSTKQGLPSWIGSATAARTTVEYDKNVAVSHSNNFTDVNLGFGERAISAAGAAVISAILVNPLDVAKTRLQAQAAGVPYDSLCNLGHLHSNTVLTGVKFNPSGTRAVIGAEPRCSPECFRYKGTLDVFYKIIRQEGFTRLWRGTNASLTLAIPSVGIYLPLYDIFRNSMEEYTLRNIPIATPYVPLVAGSLARSIACITCYPVELARTRMQNDPERALRMTTRQTLVEIWRDGGLKGLFTGIGPRVARAGPSVGIVVSFYEVVKYCLHRRQMHRQSKGVDL